MTIGIGRMFVGLACGAAVMLAVAGAAAVAPESRIEAALQEYAHNLKAMDAAQLAKSFTADGELLQPGMKALRGPAEIQAFLSSFTGVRVESVSLKSESTQAWGPDALQWGTYAERVVVGDKPAADSTGRFAVQWRRDASGRWLIRRLMMQPAP